MTKIILGLTWIILILLSFTPAGQANGDMVCKVSQPVPKNCTPYLLLEYADLTISELDRFALRGRYAACYHSDDGGQGLNSRIAMTLSSGTYICSRAIVQPQYDRRLRH